MDAKHTPGTKYSNSTIADFATDRVIHGFQVFEQEFTGRESFIDPRTGMLCGIELAERFSAPRSSARLPLNCWPRWK